MFCWACGEQTLSQQRGVLGENLLCQSRQTGSLLPFTSHPTDVEMKEKLPSHLLLLLDVIDVFNGEPTSPLRPPLLSVCVCLLFSL